MPRKTDPFIHYPKWTESRFWTFIRSALRVAWNKYPVKYQAVRDAYVCDKINSVSGRMAKHYQCRRCLELYPQKDIVVDHVVPVGTLKDYDDLPMFVKRMFCGVDDLQVLCKKCHKEKSKEERAII